MNSNFLSFSSFQPFPDEITDLIVQNSTLDSNIHFTKKGYYQNFIQAETDQKIGLYGENLAFLGMKLQEELNSLRENFKNEFSIFENKFSPIEIEYCELLKIKNLKMDQCCILIDKNDDEIFENSNINPKWKLPIQQLFYRAMSNPEGSSKITLENLSLTVSNGAVEALAQLNKLPLLKEEKSSLKNDRSEINQQFSKELIPIQYLDLKAEKEALKNSYDKKYEKILKKIANLSLMKKNENFIYEVCGGKSKFHDLKILVLDPVNTKAWSSRGVCYIDAVKELESGQSVMRGIAMGERPFLAIKYSEDDMQSISIFFQRFMSSPDDWFECGGRGLLVEYNGLTNGGCTSLKYIMHKSNQHGENLYKYYPMKIALKTLLTTGICQAPNKPTYKLVTEK